MARSLTLRHMAKLVATEAGNPPDPPPLGPNRMQLYNYYKPGLEAGNYTVEAKQIITATSADGTGKQKYVAVNRTKTDPPVTPTETTPAVPQEFQVVAPQFSLDPKLINSHYPPDGHQDEGRVLPHIVLNDPHFPWERYAGNGEHVQGSDVPWVALMVFDPEDLRLTAEDVSNLNLPKIKDFNDGGTIQLDRQRANGTFRMAVQDFLKCTPTVDFKTGMSEDKKAYEALQNSTELMQAIFPTRKQFGQFFSGVPDVEASKYMAHVRNINTVGFPDAGVEENGLFSVVVSRRTGAFDIIQPTTQICHLVSIEHVDSTFDSIKNLSDTGRIGMISLCSWIYTALPPNPINFVDTITNVLIGMQMLRPNDASLEKLAKAEGVPSGKAQVAAKLISDRLKSGYTVSRWRAETGEETVAFNRGPLVPQKVPSPLAENSTFPSDWPTSSNTSKDYQILDSKTGFMDLSYSSAWQLGKILAIADTAFNAALMRFRSLVYNRSASRTRLTANSVRMRQDLIASIAPGVKDIDSLSSGNTGDPRRVMPPPNRSLAPSLEDASISPLFSAQIKQQVIAETSAGGEIYNEFNLGKPSNSDWPVIHTWISEKLSLTDIPAHFIIPDPSFLPEESLRHFYIDDNWLDCLVDGALSVANHLDRGDDRIRNEIKQTYNYYLSQEIGTTKLVPQIPCYGFILRSQIVKVMPDLRITVKWKIEDKRSSVCRYTRPDDHTILCLLDRFPEELESITLSQPPHQQRFSLGHHLDKDKLEFQLQTLYTKGGPEDTAWFAWRSSSSRTPSDNPAQEKWFSWKTRVVKAGQLAKDLNQALQFGTDSDPQAYIDNVPNSSELALELNDPSYFFEIRPDKNKISSVATPRNRQLWTSQDSGSTDTKPSTDTTSVSGSLGSSPLPPKPAPGGSPFPADNRDSPARPSVIKFIDRPAVPANPSKPLGLNTPMSCFTLVVYPDYKGPPTLWSDNSFDRNNYIPLLNTYMYDLIFSIRKRPERFMSDYSLREILINIPHTGNKAANVEPVLDEDYDGPGARMNSNQRFTPFINRTKEFLQVRLVPRSALEHPSLTINDKKSKEVSFRLGQTNVNQSIKIPRWVNIHNANREQLGSAEIDMYERYDTPGGVYSVLVKAFVIKRPVQDKDANGNLM